MAEKEDYESVHRNLQTEQAIKRERELLEGIAPAIAFLEQKKAQTTEALESLKRVRATALREIQQLDVEEATEHEGDCDIYSQGNCNCILAEF